MKLQHRQNLLRSLSKSLPKTIFPRSSINLFSAFFQTAFGDQKPPQAQGVTVPVQMGFHLSPPPLGRVLGEALPACCSPSLHHPGGTPALCHQYFAAFPILLALLRDALHPGSFFHVFEVG